MSRKLKKMSFKFSIIHDFVRLFVFLKEVFIKKLFNLNYGTELKDTDYEICILPWSPEGQTELKFQISTF